MGPAENSTRHPESLGAGRRKRQACRRRGVLRARRCLLKGCEQRFHPRQARQRYCSERCRKAARKWSRWKAQRRYRKTAPGQQKRNGQSRRYRERAKSRKPPEPEAVLEAPRVITSIHFFRPMLRPAGLLGCLTVLGIASWDHGVGFDRVESATKLRFESTEGRMSA